MKLAFPIQTNNGLASAIAPNFRAAPALLIVDTDHNTQNMLTTAGSMCSSVPDDVQVVIFADGMGAGMFGKMVRKGMQIYQSNAATVQDAMTAFNAGSLTLVGGMECNCGDDEHEHHHSHDHDHGDGCCCH